MKKLNKKAVAVKYLIALIVGLCVLLILIWIIWGTQKENYNILETIKNFF